MSNKINKFCPKCNKILSLESFGQDKSTKDGLRCWCRECNNLSARKYIQKFSQKVKIRKKIYRLKNKENINKKAKISKQKHKFINMVYSSNHLSRTRHTGEEIVPFDLWKIAKKQKLICPLSGIKLTNENISLDHIIPFANGGKHIPENLQLVAIEINMMKLDHSIEEFKNLVKIIHDHLGLSQIN